MTKREAKIIAFGELIAKADCDLDSGCYNFQQDGSGYTEEDQEKISVEMDAIIQGLRNRFAKLDKDK